MNCTGKRCLAQCNKVNPATCPAVSYCPQATPPKTNADRIRSMTDEELAKYLDGVKRSTYNCTMLCNGETCVKCWLDWLKEEVTA